MKVKIVIEGNVQGIGYRTMIKQVARRLRIKGLVRNLDDGRVESFCECDENTLNKFIEIIDRKGNPEQPFSLNVEKINVYKEGDVNCVGLPEEFGLFETDYRMEIDPVHKDSLERSEIGILILSSMHQDLKEGQDKMLEKQDETIEVIGNRFDNMDTKYGDISKTIASMNEKLDRLTNLFEKLVNRFVSEK